MGNFFAKILATIFPWMAKEDSMKVMFFTDDACTVANDDFEGGIELVEGCECEVDEDHHDHDHCQKTVLADDGTWTIYEWDEFADGTDINALVCEDLNIDDAEEAFMALIGDDSNGECLVNTAADSAHYGLYFKIDK